MYIQVCLKIGYNCIYSNGKSSFSILPWLFGDHTSFSEYYHPPVVAQYILYNIYNLYRHIHIHIHIDIRIHTHTHNYQDFLVFPSEVGFPGSRSRRYLASDLHKIIQSQQVGRIQQPPFSCSITPFSWEIFRIQLMEVLDVSTIF